MLRKMGILPVIIITTYLVTIFALPPSISKQYRSDYVYNIKTNSFYKLHIESKRPWIAGDICAFEGAKLMVPSSQQDVIQLHTMFKRYPDLGQFVFVGVDNEEHEAADEQPIINLNDQEEDLRSTTILSTCEVMTRKGEVETVSCLQELPFICKVGANDAVYSDECKAYGKDYQYNATTRSCYKISKVAMNWDQAYSECLHEGSHLVVLNSETEQKVVWELMKKEPKVASASAHWFYFAGFRADRTTKGAPRVFRTVFNDTLEEAGYNHWSEHEPNNFRETEYCGSIFKNDGFFNDLNCAHEYAFICETEILA